MSRELLLNYGINIPRRTIYIVDRPGDESDIGIDSQMAMRIYTGLSLIRGPKPIQLLISCTGGDDDYTRGIIGAMRSDGRDFHGTVYGIAESAAAWIFQHCDRRIMTSHSSLMLHLGSGTKDAHSEYIDRLFVEDVWARMLEREPSYPRSKLMSQVKHDWQIYPTQALELGLCDEVV